MSIESRCCLSCGKAYRKPSPQILRLFRITKSSTMATETMTNGTNGVNGADAAAASLDKIQAPAGIIIPPPGEIREAIEKTAGYVVRGGTGLEMRIRENHGTNPKFSFLMTDKDPYNAYYEWRKSEIKSGRGTAVAAGRTGADAALPAKAVPKGPEKPPDFQFSARMPRMNQKDLEVLRLTALFVARNGRQFMTQLAQRENGNPQFSFLIPNHTFHNVFQSMIDQYGIILKEGGLGGDGQKAQQARMAELMKNVEDKFHVLARAKQRAEYARWLEAEKKKQEEEEEKKKTEFFSIDWNDFVLVETIVFTEADESINLPPPTTLNDIQYASLEEKNKVSLNSLRIEEAFPFDDNNYNAYPPQNYGTQELPQRHENSATPESNGAYAAPSPHPGQGTSAREEEEAQRIQEREDSRVRVQQAQADARARVAPGKIKENYVPKAANRNANKVQTTICPNCRQEIALDEFDEHTRSKCAPGEPFYLLVKIHLLTAADSRTPRSAVEGAKSQGRRQGGADQPVRRRGAQPQAARQPAARRVRPGHGPGDIGGGAGAAEAGGAQQLRRQQGRAVQDRQAARQASAGGGQRRGADQAYPREVRRRRREERILAGRVSLVGWTW